MKIIEQGTRPEEKTYQARCTSCRSLIEFTRGEARYESDPRNESFLIIKCPVCGRDIYHSVQ